MNATAATALIPALEAMFGQVYGWTLPQTAVFPYNVRSSSYIDGLIKIGAGKASEAVFSFVWFHEAYHFVQFALEGQSDEAHNAAAAPFLAARDNDGYVWVKTEREANVAAFEMCKRLGLTDFIPEWIPAGYFE